MPASARSLRSCTGFRRIYTPQPYSPVPAIVAARVRRHCIRRHCTGTPMFVARQQLHLTRRASTEHPPLQQSPRFTPGRDRSRPNIFGLWTRKIEWRRTAATVPTRTYKTLVAGSNPAGATTKTGFYKPKSNPFRPDKGSTSFCIPLALACHSIINPLYVS
jgi:hypothetical protein